MKKYLILGLVASISASIYYIVFLFSEKLMTIELIALGCLVVFISSISFVTGCLFMKPIMSVNRNSSRTLKHEAWLNVKEAKVEAEVWRDWANNLNERNSK